MNTIVNVYVNNRFWDKRSVCQEDINRGFFELSIINWFDYEKNSPTAEIFKFIIEYDNSLGILMANLNNERVYISTSNELYWRGRETIKKLEPIKKLESVKSFWDNIEID